MRAADSPSRRNVFDGRGNEECAASHECYMHEFVETAKLSQQGAPSKEVD
jgi:hypothetical protein